MSAGPETLYGAIRDAAARQRAREALVFLDAGLKPTRYTYETLVETASVLAGRFTSLGLPGKAPAALLLRSQEAQSLHYLGALAAGLVPAILTPPNPKFNGAYYERTIRALLQPEMFALVVSDCAPRDCAVPVAEPWTITTQGSGGPHRIEPVDAAFLQFSSGTTGIKRGVMVSDEAALAQIRSYGRAIDLTPDDRIVSWLPLYHDMGFITALNAALVCGCCSIMLEPLDWVLRPALYLAAVSEFRGTLGWHPNFAFAFMADRVPSPERCGFNLSSLRALVNCSEPVTRASQERFARHFAECGFRDDAFGGCYAMAETTFAVTHGTARDNGYFDARGPAHPPQAGRDDGFVSVGRPLPDASVVVVGSDGVPLPDRHVGELLVSAPFTMSGYYRNPQATREAFDERYYRTGDLGYRVGDSLFVTGRAKDLLIVGGVNVYPQDVEAIVSDIPGVHAGRVAAFATFDRALQTERVTVLAEADVAPPRQAALVIIIRQALASALQLSSIDVHLVPSGWLVKSTAGKVARRATREKWEMEVITPS